MREDECVIKKILVLGGMIGVLCPLLAGCGGGKDSVPDGKASQEILNVSYDPTREFYGAYNELFARK